MKALSAVMNGVTAYRLWMAPFAEKKLEPVRRHNDLQAVGRVLDVGCGPGTNARHFVKASYLGVDHNPQYIEWARRRWGERFAVGDVTQSETLAGGEFDFILVNSLLHHIEDSAVRRILRRLSSLLTVGGHVHILDLVLPERPSVARRLAQWDRGDYPRPLAAWRALFTDVFEPVLFEPYRVSLAGITLWNMVYFKGRRKS